MSESNLELLSRLEAEATQGPWEHQDVGPCDGLQIVASNETVDTDRWVVDDNCGLSEANAKLIPAARNALPHLLKIAEQSAEIGTSVPDDIPGLGYLTIQVDRKVWRDFKAALAAFDAAKIGREP